MTGRIKQSSNSRLNMYIYLVLMHNIFQNAFIFIKNKTSVGGERKKKKHNKIKVGYWRYFNINIFTTYSVTIDSTQLNSVLRKSLQKI